MIFETIKTEGLAALSYIVGDEQAGCAVVIDPRRDVQVYLDLLRRCGLRLTGIIETHTHADFVSGARELCTLTNATVYAGPGEYGHAVTILQDGESVDIGALKLRALHTPGHSPEHLCLVLSGGGPGAEGEWALFTGDALFNGEVGRPDLVPGVDAEEGARQLYRSLHGKILGLDDGLEVYPSHGHGSPCGGRIGVRNCTTLGYEKRHNRHLQAQGEDDFVRGVLGELAAQPPYYERVRDLNRRGPGYLGTRPQTPWLDPHEFQEAARDPLAVILDTREIEAFADAHIEGSLNIALREAFPLWAGWMLSPSNNLLVILDSPDHEEAVERHLLRLGLESIGGFLRGGMRAHIEAGLPWRSGGHLSVHELHEQLARGNAAWQLLDVRRDDEWAQGHIAGAQHAFLGRLPDELPRLGLDREKPVAVYCGSGYRSSMAVSMLERQGYRDVRNVLGSVSAWKAAGFELAHSHLSA
ncbi:MBL fold metallo-hydrolase [Deinococcus peraridilitoris]|uniref:Zn-dependent hydrolase, glyoxylase n=1 Tax=Deinococcus peraridilitoris (strain DSM 19664 / LMG 22246 / CIP 109416 / KR-200) TaxID=937777 RepID=L0A3C6_DEIPD|nr:MBL fold metallo-hydrolase [Deinococcus peraridilitoris]AFZ67944.1 Zn-dependent hydrolase, glyoxylase [Deinococcus peraridilitoris DSM 19664]